MSLVEFLVQGAQHGYVREVEQIAQQWESMLGPNAIEVLDESSFVNQLVDKLESDSLPKAIHIQLISDLLALSWWRGLTISDQNAERLFHCATRCFVDLCSQIEFPSRNFTRSKARQNHNVFVGTLQDPGHSPSSAAIDYIGSLALNESVESVKVFYNGSISHNMQIYIDRQINPTYRKSKIRFIVNEFSEDFLFKLYSSEPATYHFMCEPHLAPIISILNFLGPTIMFICSDEIPFQYSDLYWFTKDKTYIENLWKRRGAPRSLINNYHHINTYPTLVERPMAPRTRSSLDIKDDSFVIVTVGNRLGIDLDESFVTGIEQTLKRYPNAVWLVVGDLPDNLIYACHTVMQDQFRYVSFERELGNLLALADVFANPFRPGGGVSAHIALAARCIVLSLNNGGVAALVPDAHRASDGNDYFARLDRLIIDKAYREDWVQSQQSYFGSIADTKAFSKDLLKAVDLAHSRFQKRLGKSLSELVYGDIPDHDSVRTGLGSVRGSTTF